MNELGIYNGTTLVFTQDKKINLTDMWKAADGRNSQRPTVWLNQEGTKRFLKSLEKHTSVTENDTALIDTVIGGTDPGTWGHYQVALAYAKYLSPEFHIWCNEVIKEHIETKGVPVAALPDFTNPAEAARAWASEYEGRLLAEKQREELADTLVEQSDIIDEQRPKVKAFDTYLTTENSMTFTEVAKSLGFKSAIALTTRLRKDGILFKRTKTGENIPYAPYVKYFDMIRVVPDGRTESYPQTRVRPEGHEWLRQMYCEEEV